MDLRYSDADVAFRAELREWLGRTLPELPSPPARDDWPARVRYDTDWQRRLFDAGYAGMSWPKEYGGRDASPSEQLIFLEETTRAKAPYVGVNFVGHAPRRADAHRRGHARAEGRAPPEDPPRRRGVVPVLLRARRRLRPRVAADACGARRRRLRRHRPEDLVLVRPGRRRSASCSCAPTPTSPKHKGITLAHPPDGPARHRDPAASRRCSGRRSSARCSSTRCGSPSRTASARRTTGGASRT